MELLFGILVGVVVLVVLVALHEFGHGLVAHWNGVKVKEFGIGFPPRAWGKKIKNSVLGKNVIFSLNWLPLGGFVQLQGEYDSSKGKGDYGAASYWVKTKILLAGVFVNWIIAALLFTILALFGMPKLVDNQFYVGSDADIKTSPVTLNYVAENSPAEKAGLGVKDEIKSFNGQNVSTSEDFRKMIAQNSSDSAEVSFVRNGEEKTATINLEDKDGKKYAGISFVQSEKIRSTWSAPIVGFGVAVQFTQLTLQGVGDLFVNLAQGLSGIFSSNQEVKTSSEQKLQAAGDSVSGPVGILGIIFPAASQAGFEQVLMLTAIISLTLAVMNVLPLPVFDGGRWFLMTIFRILKKPLTEEIEQKIYGISYLVMIGIVILITVLDIKRF